MSFDVDLNKIIDDIAGGALEDNKIMSCPVEELKIVLSEIDLNDLDIQKLVLDRWRRDVNGYIKEFLNTSDDPHAGEGMYKCSLETWKACANYIGLNYFLKYKLVRDYKREKTEGGARLRDSLIELGLVLYEEFCNQNRKQFFIYDSCKFLGISIDYMYTLNDMHARYLKKAHSIQEDSMRTALASGRSNVTAMAILLNHDYDYTRTTQVIHTTGRDNLSADKLPQLGDAQQIAVEDSAGIVENSL